MLQLKDEPVENLRPIKVRVIGAGYSGIYLGIRIPQRIRNVDLKIYEKNEGVGGTWWENRYPGCACDIPSHSYQYSFEPNPDWSAFYAPAKEICAYLHGIAEKYGAMRFVNTSHKVTSCRWDDSLKKWHLTVVKTATGETFEDVADVVVSARGYLNEIAWPKIDGLETFKGEVMHSAKWDQKYDFKNKRIGIIGGGSSSIQIVPVLQKVEGTHLNCFVRSKTWISNPFGDEAMQKLGLDPKELDFSPEMRDTFATNPEAFLEFRRIIEREGNTIHSVTHKNSALQKDAVQTFTAMMKLRLAKKPEIVDALTPSFAVGCRRLTPGPGYLEALVEDNVDFTSERIAKIVKQGVVLESGRTVMIDVLVCATGFNTSSPPPFEVIGKKGQSLQERFKPLPTTYLSLAVDSFPNFFMMLGPNSGVGSGSLTIILENQGDYITKCIRKLQKEDYASMAPLPARVRDFERFCERYFEGTVYMDECNSWYRAKADAEDKGRITGLWPGSTLHCIETLRAPRWEDFEYESLEREGEEKNKLSWLGNGWSVTQTGQGDPAWYLEGVDIPVVGKPEDDPEGARRPFSH